MSYPRISRKDHPLRTPIQGSLAISLSAVSDARIDRRRCGEHGALARVRYRDLKEAARGAADAGVMQIQLSEGRFGGVPGRRRKAQHASGREEGLLKAQMWWGKDDLGEQGKRVGWTGRHKER